MLKDLSTNNQYGADITNWKTPPFNRWAFNHIQKLIPTVTVATNGHEHEALSNASRRIDETTLKMLLEETLTDAIVVLHEGKIVYEAYVNGNTEHTPHLLMSASKSIIGLLAGMLEYRGQIDLAAPVSTYLQQTIGTVYEQVTLRQLLDMRVGITLNDKEQRSYDLATNWEPVLSGETPIGLHEFFSQLTNAEIIENDSFKYVSANTDLLGWVLESATGFKLNVLMSDLLWKPMGAGTNAYITTDINGFPRASGGFCATARDFARVGQLIADGGVCNSNAIIPTSLLKDITNNGDKGAWERGQWGKAFAPISKNMCYRNGWYLINDQPQLIFAMGIYGQNLFIDCANRIVVAKFSSWKMPTDYLALSLTHKLIKVVQDSFRN
jgi:CubicO group peptidase (beta-lactamase class C family)